MDTVLYDILVCPATRTSLCWGVGPAQERLPELWSRAAKLAYPVDDGIPLLLADRARELSANEVARLP